LLARREEQRMSPIQVHDGDGDVHVSLPAHLFTRIARQVV
jgi:hypothetical protein